MASRVVSTLWPSTGGPRPALAPAGPLHRGWGLSPLGLPAVGVQVLPSDYVAQDPEAWKLWIIQEAVTLLRPHGMSAGEPLLN